MIPLSDLYNIMHYQLWERRLQKCLRALGRWGRQRQRRWEGWRVRRQAGQEVRRTRMEAIKDGLIEQALARAVLDKSGQELREALLAEVWEQHKEALLQQALEQVRREQQEAENTRQERWQAQKAKERRELAKEAEQLIEEAVTRSMADERQEFEERRQRLIGQRDEASAARVLAESWIVEHIKELLPGERRVLLRGPEITKFRLHTLNTILAKHGLEVKARLTDTPELVATEVGPSRWEQRSRFRLIRLTPGVALEGEAGEDTGAMAEVSQDGQTSTS